MIIIYFLYHDNRRTDMPSAPTSQRRYDDSQIFFRCYHAMTNPDYCNSNVNGDPCCTRRILHVEPFVQPTLLENWVTLNRPIGLYYLNQNVSFLLESLLLEKKKCCLLFCFLRYPRFLSLEGETLPYSIQ